MSRILQRAERVAARLTAVVVLPTPPFWLARARMRGAVGSGGDDRAQFSDKKDGGVGFGAAGEALHLHVPVSGGLGQLSFCHATLRKDSDAICHEKFMCVGQKAVQWRQSTRSYGGERGQGCGLDSLRMDGHMAQTHFPHRLTEESAFALIGFHQMHGPRHAGCQDQPG